MLIISANIFCFASSDKVEALYVCGEGAVAVEIYDQSFKSVGIEVKELVTSKNITNSFGKKWGVVTPQPPTFAHTLGCNFQCLCIFIHLPKYI